MPPSALDRQCPSFVFLLEAELMGGATFVKTGRPPLRLRWSTNLRFARWPVFHQASRKKKNHIFVWHLAWFIFFSLSILRLTHRYLTGRVNRTSYSIRT